MKLNVLQNVVNINISLSYVVNITAKYGAIWFMLPFIFVRIVSCKGFFNMQG